MLPNLHFPADLVIFTEEIINVKLHFLCNGEFSLHLHHHVVSSETRLFVIYLYNVAEFEISLEISFSLINSLPIIQISSIPYAYLGFCVMMALF